MSSSDPAYPSPASFLPVLHPVSGEGTLFSPLHQSPPEADSQTWQNTTAPDTKNLSKPPSTTLTYLGMAAEQGLGHSGSTALALLPSGSCWRSSSHCCTHRAFGSSRHLQLHLQHWLRDIITLTWLLEGSRLLWGRERKGWKNFSGASRFSSGFTSCPPGWKSGPYVIEKFSLQVFKQTSYFLNVRIINYKEAVT